MKEMEFNFFEKDEYNASNFIIYNENIEAFYYLNQDLENVNYSAIFLTGAKKSGKTYISKIWKQKHNAKYIDYNILELESFEKFVDEVANKVEVFDCYLIDDFGINFKEDRLLFLLNYVAEKHSKLLIVSDFEFNKVKIKLKDLKSRINSSIFLKIKKLPKEIKPMFILKLFNDKKIPIPSGVLKFLLQKLPNDYEKICDFVRIICCNVRENGEKLTLEYVKKLF
jgi:chromosomal replication initiation ATPase DnaA